jgi:regulator of RNase E activity RraA
VAGCAVTVKITAAGLTPSRQHLGVAAIEQAQEGDVIVIDNGGRLDTSCWGGILATAARLKGIAGVVIDGACRDVDECLEAGFPVYARGAVVAPARGRIMEEATNVAVQFTGVRVDPGDIVVGDRSGVVIIPLQRAKEVLARAEALLLREEQMIADLNAGLSIVEVDAKYQYQYQYEILKVSGNCNPGRMGSTRSCWWTEPACA